MRPNLTKGIFVILLLFLYACTKKIVIPSKGVPTDMVETVHLSNTWTDLESYPVEGGRNDDLFFFNEEEGWVINNSGRLYSTKDGGKSWQLRFEKAGSFFRCIVFTDSLNGWLGTIGLDDHYLYSADSIILYETHDGGTNWQPSRIEGSYPSGLCGLQKVTDNMLVGCGRVRGPSYFIKTMDKGKTWISINLDDQAGSLIAPYFFDDKNGFLIGGTTRDKLNSRALILSTKDGGKTWKEVFRSSQTGEYCWKIVFPSEKMGYVSIQRNVRDGQFNFIRTRDGGKTWEEKKYADKHYFTQGIGFINEDIGWIGGSSSYGTYETNDGGENWVSVPDAGKSLNKFQFINDTLGYAVGRGIYKINLKKEK